MKKIKELINKIFLEPIPNIEGDIKSYIRAIESGKFKNKMVYGIADKEKGFLAYDPVKNPGALYCGSMGSGKSIAMRFSVATHIATNSENTVYLLMDPLKGMNDYALLFDGKKMDFSKNVAHAIDDAAKIVPLIDMVFDEVMERKFLFSIFSSKSIYDIDLKLDELYQKIKHLSEVNEENELYEKIINEKIIEGELLSEIKSLKEEKILFYKIFHQIIELIKTKEEKHPGLARIIICIEEFHKIPNSNYVKFNMKVDQEGSIANKMKELMRIGRSYGISFMFATQRGTAEDVPTSLKPGLSILMCFKMSNPGEAGALNLPHANEITNNQRGRCAYEEGFIQYPYLDDKPLEQLMKRYYKPLKAFFLKYEMPEYRIAFSGKGNSGMVKIKPFSELIKFYNQYEFEDIVERLLSKFNIVTEPQENTAYVAEQIGFKGDDKYAIKLIKERGDGSEKEIEALKKGAEKLGCNKILIIGVDFIPPHLTRVKDNNMIVLDKDDLMQISNIFDNQKVLEKEGSYNELYLQYPLSARSDLGLPEEIPKEEEKEASKIEISYSEIVNNEQDINAYVDKKIEIKEMPLKVKEEFDKNKLLFEKEGILPKINDPLIDDLIDKKDKLMSPPMEEKKDDIEQLLQDKLMKLKSKIKKKEDSLSNNLEIKDDFKDLKKKQTELNEKKNSFKIKKGLTKESILNLREELKKELLSAE